MGVRTVDGLRWSCTGCAACCRAGYALGPVAPATIARLEAEGIRERWPAAADGWTEERRGPDGESAAYLRAPGGACLFLMEDDRCAIHALVGAEAKPWFCRRFPLAPIADARGEVVVVLPGCQGHHRTFETAAALPSAALEEAVASTPASRRARFAPEAVAVLPGRGVSLDDWMYLEDRALGALEGDPLPWEGVRRIRAELVRGMPGGWPEPDPDEAERAGRYAMASYLEVLRRLGGGTAEGPHGSRVEAARQALVRALAAAPGEPEPALEPAARRWLALQLRSAILGKWIHAPGCAVAGLGLFLVGVDLCARSWADRPVPVAAFGRPWAMWQDLLGHRALRATSRVLAPALVSRAIRA